MFTARLMLLKQNKLLAEETAAKMWSILGTDEYE